MPYVKRERTDLNDRGAKEMPTPAEIAERAAAIRRTWTRRGRELRTASAYRPLTVDLMNVSTDLATGFGRCGFSVE